MSARLLGRVVRVLEERGIEPVPILESAGFDRDELANASTRVSYARVDLLIDRVARQVDAADLGLALARVRDDDAYGAAAFMLLASNTYRQGLSRAFGYQRLWGDGERFRIFDQGGVCAVSFRHPGRSALAGAVIAECALAEILDAARRLVEPAALPRSVEFSHQPLGDTAALTKFLSVRPAFGCRENVIVLGPEVADRPLHLLRDALRDVLSKTFEAQCRSALAALPDYASTLHRVRAAVREAMSGRLTLSAIAVRLKMSTRTLQRGLQSEGTSFQELVDIERKAQADEWIGRGAAVKEAALRVGYADASALARARRRWRGVRAE